MEKYEEKKQMNIDENKKYIEEFEEWLTSKKLTKKTIDKHISNTTFYLNEYLNYYDITKMKDGIHLVYPYFNGWFVEKCLWASKSAIKENASSIKKFYQCMSENGYVKVEEYNFLAKEIKENMEEFIEMVDAYNNDSFYDIFN